MRYEEFLQELDRAGLTVRAFAELIGMNPNSISNYARDAVPSHLALIAVLAAELRSHGVDYRLAMARIVVSPKKPRGGAERGRFGGDRQSSLNLDGGAIE